MSSAKRSRSLPDVPTVIESGLPGFEAGSWFGFFAPKGTPEAVDQPRSTGRERDHRHAVDREADDRGRAPIRSAVHPRSSASSCSANTRSGSSSCANRARPPTDERCRCRETHCLPESRSPMIAFTCADILAGRAPKDAPVTVKGWVRTRRDSKAGISFVHVSDGSCFHPVQVVAPNTPAQLRGRGRCTSPPAARWKPPASSCLRPPRASRSRCRRARSRSIGWVEDPDSYPIQPKPHTLEFLREVAHLRPRTNVIGAVTRVRHTIAQSIHRFFHDHGFFWVNTPIITASDAEGAGELFRVSTLDLMNLPRTPEGKIDFAQDFFGREAFLTVSGQLNVETYCLALSKVYTFGPTFRAENSNTSRHLAEFWMIEPEIAFANLCRRRHAGRGAAEAHLQDRARRARRRHGFLRGTHREGCDRQAAGHRRLGVRAHGLHRGDPHPGAVEAEVRVPGRSGASTCSPSTSAISPRSTRASR